MGVRVETKEKGDEENYPAVGDYLVMHYTGTLASNGKKFDSSVDREEPFAFNIGVGQVIRGWEEGVIKMSLGEKAILHISSEFGYGVRGAGKDIPPNSDLLFEVELLAINGQYRKKEGGFSRCSSCLKYEEQLASFNRCGSCLSVFYCSRLSLPSHLLPLFPFLPFLLIIIIVYHNVNTNYYYYSVVSHT